MTIDLATVRELITLDGGDVELISESDSGVDLRLILEDASCAECIMPRGILEEVATKLLGVAVRIQDPRE